MPSYAYREHREPHKIVQILRNRKLSLLVGIAFLTVLMVTFSNKGLLRRIVLEREVGGQDAKITELTADIKALRKERDMLRDDRAMIERVAREQHGMIKPGELVYRIRPGIHDAR